MLRDAIRSLQQQSLPPDQFEVIIVDNGSTDNTKDVVLELAKESTGSLEYVSETVPGALSARHRGANEALGQILVFTDDDVIASPVWLETIKHAFDDPETHFVGGPSTPHYEVEPPAWLRWFWSKDGQHEYCGSLSLQNFGEVAGTYGPANVWSLNLSIRKETLYTVGGFNPDIVPKSLQYFQGDGETGLALKIKAHKLKAMYYPGAHVKHRIPGNRMTVDAFCDRFYFQGVADSYTNIRALGKADEIQEKDFNPEEYEISQGDPFRADYLRIKSAYVDGYNYHLCAAINEPVVLEWVCRENYFDYRLPELGPDRANLFQKNTTKQF